MIDVVMILLILLAAILGLSVLIPIGVYVYRDAARRGMNGVLWTLVVIFAPSLIGFIIYLLVRNKDSDLRCPQCDTPVKEQYVVCPKCGTKLKPSCPNCVSPVEPDWKICPRCAKPLPEQYEGIEAPIRPKDKALWKILVVVIVVPIVLTILMGVAFFSLLFFSESEVEVNTDINKYNDYIGRTATEKYQNKWDMDERIFPKAITEHMDVIDYKMVYYDPWDAQYLSYLVVDYTDGEYEKEVERLKNYDSTGYVGYYGVTGFKKYELLAIYADEYQGFVYAITDNQNRIIYVELIFCNYFMDLDYEEYMDSDYLPDGFDATIDNPYRKEMLR